LEAGADPGNTWMAMSRRAASAYDRVSERHRAVALARHFRDAEGLSIAHIADRLDLSPATIKAYFYDPTGEKARAVKARYQGVCRGCGAYTQPRNGKGDAYRYCKVCHPGAIEPRLTQERALAAMRDWRDRYGRLPSSYDWSRTHARRRGREALERLRSGDWPAASVVTAVWGSWSAARRAIGAASSRAGLSSDAGESREVDDWAQAHLCAQSPVIRREIRGSDVARESEAGLFAQ
jgi:AraC-like DNA-binding protein